MHGASSKYINRRFTSLTASLPYPACSFLFKGYTGRFGCIRDSILRICDCVTQRTQDPNGAALRFPDLENPQLQDVARSSCVPRDAQDAARSFPMLGPTAGGTNHLLNKWHSDKQGCGERGCCTGWCFQFRGHALFTRPLFPSI